MSKETIGLGFRVFDWIPLADVLIILSSGLRGLRKFLEMMGLFS